MNTHNGRWYEAGYQMGDIDDLIGTSWLMWRAEKYETFPAAVARATAAFVERYGSRPSHVIVNKRLIDEPTDLTVLVRPTVAAGEMMLGPIRPVEG